MKWLCKFERLLLILGVLMLALYEGAGIHQGVLSHVELRRFEAQQPVGARQRVVLTAATPDFSLWAEQRVKDYQQSLASHFAPAIGILRIPKIQVEVPVLQGTDDLSLNRGVGHVAGTPLPGENGNVAIAGHRDGFFRGLKDVGLGDKIEMVSPLRTETFIIDRITIVERTDISVLQPREHSSLTLITCYPFYFIGGAPRRYIVQASVADSVPTNEHVRVESRAESGPANQQALAR